MKERSIFVGTSVVVAIAMRLGEYNDLRGWIIPPNEDEKAEGYLVEHQHGEQNHPNYVGRISWMPKSLFEAEYRQICQVEETKPLIVKLIGEFNAVNDNTEPLRCFLSKPKPDFISQKEWLVLHDQLDAMADYRECLLARISIHTFKEETPNEPDHQALGLGELDGDDE